jgi:hypothetical protein
MPIVDIPFREKGAHLVGYYHVHPLKINLDEMGLKI